MPPAEEEGNMMSSRRTVTAMVVAVGAALSVVAPANARTGLGGYVTDADTGLAVPGATAAWNGSVEPAPTTTSAANGRYLFTGLPGGETGTLGVTGPAGWDSTAITPITIPAADVGTQDVALHRDWAATAGGASTATSDDASAPAGCGAGAATDSNPATAWAATTPTASTTDAPTLTVTLPQAIDLEAVVLDPGPACDHAPGAALKDYKILTSADGVIWTPAALGTAGATKTTIDVSATAIRQVRLEALAPQDPASATIDLRALQVFGAGPNVAPTGTVAADADRAFVNTARRLQATFTDPDSAIVRFLWDFNGDGHWDQATNGPSVAHVWAGTGSYHVIVGARDFRGALGTAALDLYVSDPNKPVEPVIQRKPVITFDPVDGVDLDTRIACSSKCTFTASFVLTKAMAKAIKAPKRTILTFKRRTSGPGLGSWTLSLPSKTIKLLRKAHRSKVTVRLTASAVDQQKRRTTVHRWVTFR
jgi:hypothetical protein